MNKNSLADWPALRKYITKIRFYLVKLMLNTNLDSSGGFRCYNLKTIKKQDLKLAENNGYFFNREFILFSEIKI